MPDWRDCQHYVQVADFNPKYTLNINRLGKESHRPSFYLKYKIYQGTRHCYMHLLSGILLSFSSFSFKNY